MQSAYSWMGSRIHLVLDDEVAAAYNRAQEKWYGAQHDHLQYHEKPWNPKEEALDIRLTEAELKAWNDIAGLINMLSKINGGLDIPDEELTSDLLVKL